MPPDTIQAARFRVLLPGFPPFKCTGSDARRLADTYGGQIQQSLVTVHRDGTEVLGPWRPRADHPADDAPPPSTAWSTWLRLAQRLTCPHHWHEDDKGAPWACCLCTATRYDPPRRPGRGTCSATAPAGGPDA